MSTNYSRHKWIAKHSTGWTESKKLTKAVSIIGLLMVTSCTDTFMKTKAVNQRALTADLAATADSAGNYSANIDPNSNATQRFKAGAGSVYGAAIALPVGALSIPISITIGEGESLTSSTQQIGLSSDNPATAASSSVSFVPSSAVEAANPFTLSIPISITTSLGLAEAASNENLVVLYKWMAVKAGVTTYEIGLIPRKDITMASGTAQFQTTKFGTFQLVRTAVKVEEKIKKPTDEPPILKADAGNPLVGSWGSCENKNFGQNNGNGGGNGFGERNSNVKVSCVLPSISAPIAVNLNQANPINIPSDYLSKEINVLRIPSGGGIPSQTTVIPLSTIAGKKSIEAIFTAGSPTILKNERIRFEAPSGCYFEDFMSPTPQKLAAITYENPDLDFEGTTSPIGIIGGAAPNVSRVLNPNSSFENGEPIQIVNTDIGGVTAPGNAYVCDKTAVGFRIDMTSPACTNVANFSGGSYLRYRRLENAIFSASFDASGAAANSLLFYATSHGLNTDDVIIFKFIQNNNDSSNIQINVPYYVEYYSANEFKLSTTNSGTAGDFVTVGSLYPGSFSNNANFIRASKIAAANSVTSYLLSPVANSLPNGRPLVFTQYFFNISFTNLGDIYNTATSVANYPNIVNGGAAFPVGYAHIRHADCMPSPQNGLRFICDGTQQVTGNNNQNSDGKRSLGIGPGISPKSESEFVKFSPNTFIHGNAAFFGENCTGGLVSRTEETGTYSLGAKNSDSTQAITINMMTLKAAIFPPQAVNNANSMSKTAGCGANDWVSAQPKDLNTTECKDTPWQSSSNAPKAFRIKDGKLNFPEPDGTYKADKELKRLP
ncbi:MAG: hypothetical protein NT027_10190 [Proteobacteria bacterium]|nr:hypothetical protein [Pseudomonadota bacterium]